MALVFVLSVTLCGASALLFIQRHQIARLRLQRDASRAALKAEIEQRIQRARPRVRPEFGRVSPYAPLFTEGAPDECYECETTGQNCFAHRKDGA